MKTHFAPFTDLEDLEQAPCGTWLGEASELSGDWARVDCLLCQNHKAKIIAAGAAEERFIVEQMGDMAAFMRAEDSAPQENICTPQLQPLSPLFNAAIWRPRRSLAHRKTLTRQRLDRSWVSRLVSQVEGKSHRIHRHHDCD